MIYHNKFGINSNKIIVGIHGWGGTNNTFLPIQKKLNDEFTMINFDLPGYGKSKKPSSWDLENIVDSLAVEINKITSKEVDILGNCSGALISILLSKSKKLKGSGFAWDLSAIKILERESPCCIANSAVEEQCCSL